MHPVHLWQLVNNNFEEHKDKLCALHGRGDVIATF